MRALFICKRRPQGRDLLDRPYGRFYHFPVNLAQRGHHVRVLLCSHHNLKSEARSLDGVDWLSNDLRTLGPFALLQELEREAKSFKPDWVIACSDAWYGYLAHRLAKSTGARLAVDAYDDYESYMPWNYPLHLTWRRAVRSAHVATAAGPHLAQLLDQRRAQKAPAVVVPMAADPMFVPRDRLTARRSLGLPTAVFLIGYCGGWAERRGTDVLLEAFRLVRARLPDARLVVSGRPPPYVIAEPGILATGYIDDDAMPSLVSALDVACIITANSAFGRCSYPAKLCEAMACQVPVVATSTAPVRWMLGDDSRFLVPIGDPDGIAEGILSMLRTPQSDYGELPTWTTSAALLEQCLLSVG